MTPEWVIQQIDWLKTDDPIPIEVAIGVPQSIRFRVHGVLVQPNPGRLDLIAEKEINDTYELISRIAVSIVERLPHTPIRAIGHNVAFKLDETEQFRAIQGTDLDALQEHYRRVKRGDAINQIQIKHTVESSRYTLNVTYAVSRNDMVLDLNYHYPMVEVLNLVSTLQDFSDNIAEAGELAQRLVESS